MLKSIRSEQAVLGMYVHSFSGGWLSHPLWRSRLLISSERDLARIRSSNCEIIIDTSKGRDIPPPPSIRASVSPAPMRASGRFGRADKVRASELAQRSKTIVDAMFADCRLGKGVPTTEILAVVEDIASSLNNMAAFISVTRLKAQDDQTYTHSVAVCALMINLAREIGCTAEAARDLGMAGLLHDIGKSTIPPDILLKAGPLNEAETIEMRRHPGQGHAILSATTGVPAVALDVCLHHHERLDGSGYPFGLKGEAISIATRMASICDAYDAMTSIRPHAAGKSPLEAVTQMEAADGQFDRALLFHFMGSIGVYPAGKLVRILGDRLAVTLPHKGQGMDPVFRTFYSTVETRFLHHRDVILSDCLGEGTTVIAEDPGSWFSESWPMMAARIMAGERPVRPN
ncbi:HD-GYP domain-containing protein [Sphingomonas sp. R647]|uniref:HD-GYP domain-containing protein n=1 Tax=Sphingomonas sp. R647 TaxID=2875233 RepID=UPI001CD1DDD1|nr:HD-GYP domain-containing protein [Sphingomonas sp. R647]MCA1196460.1 HD-GYP domain-containing protein [Sphingomonas sp. R647]